MGPSVVMPDVELWGTRWIRAMLAAQAVPGVFVGNKVPKPLQKRMVIVRADGGPRPDFLHQDALMVVNVYAETEQAATDLARLVEGALLSIRSSYPCEYVRSLSGPVRVEDVVPRRYFTVEAVMLGLDEGSPAVPYQYPSPDDGAPADEAEINNLIAAALAHYVPPPDEDPPINLSVLFDNSLA